MTLHIQNLCSCGITYWNNELANAQSQKENWELFYGKPSEPRDFYYSVDIPRKIQMREIENFFSENSCGFIEIKGKPFVGKTCLAQRVLTNGVEQMFKVFYCQKTDLRVCQIVKQYLDTLTPDDSILLCFEDASGYYRPLVEMFERYKDGLNKKLLQQKCYSMSHGIVEWADDEAYLLAALFNAVSTLDSYYTMQANSDFGGSF